jgi:short subunit dehydrogenase-like uncharacterized protein
LDEQAAVDKALEGVYAVLHCAGPYVYTYKPMIAACLRNGTHYVDITGEVPVYQGIARHDDEARERGVMLLPGAGFDVVATDCLAVHLQRRLPSATKLALAFHSTGPAGFPPGTINTMLELIPRGDWLRQDGRLVPAPRREQVRSIDFGRGPVEATMLTWGDVFTAHRSTGIPNIKDYAVLPMDFRRLLRAIRYARPLFSTKTVRNFIRNNVKSGSTAGEQAVSKTHVWGEVMDERGGRAVSRLHGPDGGVTWTALAALDVAEKVLGGDIKPGYQTPGSAYGPELALEAEGIIWEDVV